MQPYLDPDFIRILELPVTDPWSEVQKPQGVDLAVQHHLQGNFGQVKFPETLVNKKGVAILAAGRHLFNTPNARSFRGLVSYFLYDLIGDEFFKTQETLDMSERHPLGIWRDHTFASSEGKETLAPQEEIEDTLSWTMLAYHTYLAYENSTLPEDLISRLRIAKEFQGARFEIQAAAVMIAAGYEIEWIEGGEDRIAEFVATHRLTGLKFAVEAKSRHRPEVLAKGAPKAPSDPPKVGVQKLISKALAKNPALPLIIFLEANLPFSAVELSGGMRHELDQVWKRTLRRDEWKKLGGFPCVGMVVSNDRTWWDIGMPLRTVKYPNWLMWFDGPNRHDLTGDAIKEDIFGGYLQASQVPEFTWDNSNIPPPDVLNYRGQAEPSSCGAPRT